MTSKEIETLEYFGSNLDEAASAFIAWACFLLSRSTSITGELSHEYVEALGQVPELMQVSERNAQITWVILFCHVIEKNRNSLSLRKLDESLFKTMVADKHKASIEMIKEARDNVFAHKGKTLTAKGLPSLNDTRELFKDVFAFFSEMNSRFNRPNLVLDTIFNNGFFVEDFEKIISFLNPNRNKDIYIMKKFRIGNFLKI